MRRDYLYIIQAAVTGDFKVGRTKNVPRRLRELQTGCPHLLRVLLAAKGLGYQERQIHQRLGVFRTRVGKGEWFREEGMGSIPSSIWALIPQEVLEDPDWWNQDWPNPSV